MPFAASYDHQSPALLPFKHCVCRLIVLHFHQQGHHGVLATWVKVRKRFWVIKVSKLAKTVKFQCVVCRKQKHETQKQFMAALPYERLSPYTPPFYYASCDYFGPYQVKFGRNQRKKVFGVICTCLNVRAVHLEVAGDASTMEFSSSSSEIFCY